VWVRSGGNGRKTGAQIYLILSQADLSSGRVASNFVGFFRAFVFFFGFMAQHLSQHTRGENLYQLQIDRHCAQRKSSIAKSCAVLLFGRTCVFANARTKRRIR